MMQQICESEVCCGCMACVNICPTACIDMVRNKRGEEVPKIDGVRCISCGLCQKVCPEIGEKSSVRVQRVLAAWSNHEKIRKMSASGGIASEICRYYGQMGKWYAGCRMDEDNGCRFYLEREKEAYQRFQNSKYVYSYMGDLYKKIEAILKEKEELVFIGLPCQVAALKNYLMARNVDTNKLIIIDLICHGVVPQIYLKEWIENREKKFHRRAKKILFRNPDYGTEQYAFTLEDEKGEFYKKFVWEVDSYHFAYHHALDYREGCYHCRFAERRREGDITLGDFSGIGKVEPFIGEMKNISCVLINSEKGGELFEKLESMGCVTSVARPKEEAFLFERQLNEPSIPYKKRPIFLKYYEKTRDFPDSVEKTLRAERIKYRLKVICGVYAVKAVIPQKVKDKLREKLRAG